MLNAELTSGKSLAQMAESQRVTPEALTAAAQTAMEPGLDQAVSEDILTRHRLIRCWSRCPRMAPSGVRHMKGCCWRIPNRPFQAVIKAVKDDRRDWASGRPANQSATRCTLIAAAVSRC